DPSAPSSTSPAISWPMMTGYRAGIAPVKIFKSVPQMPLFVMRTSTWSSAGSGVATSDTIRSYGLRRTSAFMRNEYTAKDAQIRRGDCECAGGTRRPASRRLVDRARAGARTLRDRRHRLEGGQPADVCRAESSSPAEVRKRSPEELECEDRKPRRVRVRHAGIQLQHRTGFDQRH